MATADVLLALLAGGPAHGYELKRGHDAWFPASRPLAFGQVYATLGRLERSGLVEVAGTGAGSGPERTVYALSPRGRRQLRAWLAEPAEPGASAAGELVRKTVAAVRTGADAAALLARQRDAHAARLRELTGGAPERDAGAQLARDHVVAHLDADLRWLETALERVGAERGADDSRTAT
jgi:DNA-binding PadR family transcriptional regulator